ncbi:MAG TPA: EamA family transporter [Thermoplasmata archaeon]
MSPRRSQVAAFALLCIIWGSTWLAIRIGLEGAPPFLAASLRFAVASLTLLVLAFALRSKWPQNRTEWALVGFVGIVLFTADYGLIYWGENNGVESGLSAILFASFPLQTALVANAFLKAERLTLQKLLGIVVGFGGVVLIFRGQLATAGLEKVVPMLAIVVAATCAAFATIALKRWGHETEPVTFNAASMAVGAAGLAAVSLVASEPWQIPSWPQGLGAILYLALAGSVVTFVAWQWLLKQIQATYVSFIALIIPVVAIFLGVSLGGEVFDPLAIVGAAVTLGGIYLSLLKRAASGVPGIAGETVAVGEAGPPAPSDARR